MSELGTERADAALQALLEAAEPRTARPLGGLVERLAVAGRLRGVVVPGAREREVHGIAYDSRRVVPGGVFDSAIGRDFYGRIIIALQQAGGYRLACQHGPVFDARELNWVEK